MNTKLFLMLTNTEDAVKEVSGLFGRMKGLMNTFYLDLAGITTVTAGLCAAVCLFLMFFGSQQSVEKGKSWLKRIILCWFGIMFMGLIIAYFTQGLGVGNPTPLA